MSKFAEFAGLVVGVTVMIAPQLLMDAVSGILGLPHIPIADSFAEYFADTGQKLFHNL